MGNNRVLITGGCGFIGKHLCRRLVETGKDVTVLDIAAPQDGNINGCEVVRGDIGDRALVGKLMRSIDTVYHLAAVTTFHECQEDPRATFRVNVRGTAILLRETLSHNVGNFVFFSSTSVYSGNSEPVKHEEMKLEPQSTYGLTKMQGEELCSCAGKFGLPCASLRLFNVYGEGGRGVINKFVEAARGDRRIIIYGDGSQVRDYVYIDDVVRAAIAAGEGRLSGVYNVGTGKGSSVLQLKRMIERAEGITFEVEKRPRNEWDVQETLADIKKMARDLQVTPTTLEVGLAGLLHDTRRSSHQVSCVRL